MIYMLEDDRSIRNFVMYALNNSGLETRGFESPSELYRALKEHIPELLLLDIMLPEEDGISVLKKLRSGNDTKRLPVIMLTAKGTEFDKVTGLDSGADDYVSKPFGIMELISRIKALLRRSAPDAEDETAVCAGSIKIYPSRHEVFSEDELVSLTLKEYELLLFLVRNKGEVYSRDELLKQVWGYDFTGESRTVDVHIRTLRAKLGSSGELLKTIRSVGYKAGDEK